MEQNTPQRCAGVSLGYVAQNYEVVCVKGKMFVLMLAAMMVFAGVAAAEGPSIIWGANPVKELYNSSANTSILFNITFLNITAGLVGQAGQTNVSSCTLYLSETNVPPVTASIVNTTNSSGLALAVTAGTSFNFMIANSTVGAIAERNPTNAYNVTVNCSWVNGSGTFNTTNTTNFTIDITAPVVTLVSPAALLVNNTNGSLLYRFTVVDSGTNASNCSIYLGWTNTTYSLAPSFDIATNLTSPPLGQRANITYLTTATNSLFIPLATPNQKDATHNWLVECADYAGNYANSSNQSYIIDNSTPAYVTLVGPTNNTGYKSSQTVLFQWNVSDAYLKNCSVLFNYTSLVGGFVINKTVTHSEDYINSGGNWNATILFNISTNQMYLNLGGNSADTYRNWSVTCYDLWGHNTTNHTYYYIPVTNDTSGASSGGGSSSSEAPNINVQPGCAGEKTTVTVTGIKTQATVNVFRVVAGQPSQLIHTEVMSTDGSFDVVLPSKGDYLVEVSAVGQKSASVSFSVTCGAEEGAPPTTPPVTPPTTPPAITAMANAQDALDEAAEAIADAKAEGKDTSAAEAKLAEAQAAYDAGNYELALTLANEAEALARSAPAMTEEGEEAMAEEPEAEKPAAPAAGGFDWTWVIVVLVVLAVVAYFLTRKKY